MQSTPIGPTGAAMENPMTIPRKKKLCSIVTLALLELAGPGQRIGTKLAWQYSLTVSPEDGKYPGRQSMTPKIRMKSVTDARQRAPSVAIWRGLCSQIKGCNSGWASGTE